MTDRPTHYIYVLLPEDIDPGDRHDRYATILDAELRLADLGAITGGGTMMRDDDDEDAEPVVLFSGIDADVYDVDAARAVLRDFLPELGCPRGTLLQYRVDDDARCDRYDGETWWLDLDPEGLPDGPWS